MSWVYHLVAVMSVTDQPIDPTELARVRESLVAYYSRISALDMQYTARSKPNPNEPPFVKQMREESLKKKLEKLPPDAQRELRRKHSSFPESEVEFAILDRFPNLRLQKRGTRRFSHGETDTSESTCYFLGNRRVDIDITGRQVRFLSSFDRNLIPPSPINALGWRLPGTLNMTLSDLLRFPEITVKERDEVVGETKTIVLRIGPHIPSSVQPPIANPENFVRLWLSPEQNHVPVRMDFYRPATTEAGGVKVDTADDRDMVFVVHAYQVSGWKSVPDLARGESLEFPAQASFTNPGGRVDWQINEVKVNPSISDLDFEPNIPSGFSVMHDNQPTRVTMTGGSDAYKKALNDSARLAKDMLVEPPGAAKSSATVLWQGIPIFLGTITAVLLIVRRRIRNVAN